MIDISRGTPQSPGGDGYWPFCPNCGSELEEPASDYREWVDCPECGSVCIHFHKEDTDE